MIVTFPLELEQQVKARAAQKGLDIASYLLSLVQKDTGTQIAFEQLNGNAPDDHDDDYDDDYDPQALNRAVAAIVNRTSEQKKAAQERAIKEYRPKRELPPNVSPLEVMPVIRGNETDEEVRQALKELS